MTREEQIRARLEAASGKAWRIADESKSRIHSDEVCTLYGSDVVRHVECPGYGLRTGIAEQADAELIAHGPADLDYLLGENEKLRQALRIAGTRGGFQCQDPDCGSFDPEEQHRPGCCVDAALGITAAKVAAEAVADA